MLDDIKQIYYNNANLIDGWKKLSGNELCFKYVESLNSNDKNLENYLSAIICKFWSIAVKAYHSQGIKLAEPEDCYNWLIDSIQYVLEKHVWTDPQHQLYNDPKAPEKAINVVFNSTKINFFVALTRQKRKIDAQSISLDSISEDTSDSYFLPVFDNYNLFENELTDLVISYYNNRNYFDSICLDLIINEEVFNNNDSYKYKKLIGRLKSLDDNYSKLFSSIYNLDINDVSKSVHYIASLSTEDLRLKIDRLISKLKHSREIKEIFQ